jgi:two-component system LytT family response regulator
MSTLLRALVVDDEALARGELVHLLLATGRVEIVGEAADAVEALVAIRNQRPEVLFLDVQMPVVDGFQLLGMIEDELLPEVVFVTAHDQFALRAFDENAADYLLKPVAAGRLQDTLERLARRRPPASRPALASAPIERVPCRGPRTIKLVKAAEVELARSTLTGVYVVTPQGEFSTDLTLGVLEARAGLLRCHKQFLVRPSAIDEVRLEEGSTATLVTRSGHAVPVSRRHLPPLRALLGI